jgi:hypothetical protein
MLLALTPLENDDTRVVDGFDRLEVREVAAETSPLFTRSSTPRSLSSRASVRCRALGYLASHSSTTRMIEVGVGW